ncbi:GreA/GreB family elongation factor [Paenibacillus whitsoniae]|uniref:GreA/GreB family elongation factor n=1 Tax=Paenibacillus whitsoniae TaxID=2496558 RepID=A0A3S0BXZ1_9BACL|nr:GreA/GreB family elongation factor [Paenibacillus whitsoniae]RTE10766.1 GreA/GreB family elongation factor [Paenibacillus whitsoniae]
MNRSHTSIHRSRLVEQLVYLDEQLPVLLESYASQQKIRMRTKVDDYVKSMVKLLELDDDHLATSLSEITMIGSSVRLRFVEDGTHEVFKVVYPKEIDPDHNKISFFSPIGSQLLLRSRGEVFNLQTPDAEYSVQIVENFN